MNEEEIKSELGIQDWRYLKKDMLPMLISKFVAGDASPETIKAILNQIPEFLDVSKGLLKNTKEYYNTIILKSEEVTKEAIDSINSAINSIQKVLDEDKALTFEQKQLLIEKEVELARIIKECQSEQNKFFEIMANNWGKIVYGLSGVLITTGLLCLTPGGRDVAKGLLTFFNQKKITNQHL